MRCSSECLYLPYGARHACRRQSIRGLLLSLPSVLSLLIPFNVLVSRSRSDVNKYPVVHPHGGKDTDSMALAALTIALEHPLLSSDAKVLCAAARVCRAWRHAMQHCAAYELDVDLGPFAPVLQLCSFAAWLPRHAALVKAITIRAGYDGQQRTVDGFTEKQYLQVAQQLLLPAIQLAGLLPAELPTGGNPAAAEGQGGAAGVPQQQQQQQARLRLTRFSSDLEAAGMLAAMPAHSLTYLDLAPADSIGADGPSLSALLTHLSNLQQLRLAGKGSSDIPGSCLAGLVQLRRLTALHLEGFWEQLDQPLQHLMSQRLALQRLSLHSFFPLLPVLDMTALADLRELSVADCMLAQGTTLPVQLQRLSLEFCRDASSITALQQLQHLHLCVGFADQEQLRRLAQLPALQHVSLKYTSVAEAAATAPSWQFLPQLCELEFTSCDSADVPSAQHMAAIMAGVAAATSLTKLELEAVAPVNEGDDSDDDDELEVAACASLAGSTRLRELTISEGSLLVPGDALALTALTNLTRLVLAGADIAVDDVAATALACSLKQLRSLNLHSCALGTMACLAPIAHLIQLTQLHLSGIDGLTKHSLWMLTKLTSLQQLTLRHNEEVTHEVLEEFWVAVRQQQQ